MSLDLFDFRPSINAGCLPVLVLLSLLRLDPSLLCACKNKDVLKLKWLIEGASSSRIERLSMQREKWYRAFHTRVEGVRDPLAHKRGDGEVVRLFASSTASSCSSSSGLQVADIDMSTFRSFCYSCKWFAQKHFYEQSSLEAWTSNRVPSQISSNFFVARQYMDRIVQKLVQCNEKSSKNLRVVIVEIGAGHGLLSISMALLLLETSLANRLQRTSEEVAVEIFCTDFHYAAFTSLLQLPYVSHLVEQGVLTFATLTAPSSSESTIKEDNDVNSLYRTLMSRRRQQAPSDGHSNNTGDDRYDAVFMLAQYAFDSFPCHLYSTSHTDGIREIGICHEDRHDKQESEVEEMGGVKRSKKRSIGALKQREEVLVSKRVDMEKEGDRNACELAFLRSLEADPEVKENGLLAVPFGIVPLLQSIRDCFPLSNDDSSGEGGQSFYSLLAGDYFCDYDHKQWTAPLLRNTNCCNRNDGVLVLKSSDEMHGSNRGTEEVNGSGHGENVLHVPYINPIAEATAVPVSLTALHYLWSYAMGGVTKGMTGFKYLEDHSHLLASCFSTVQLSFPCHTSKRVEEGVEKAQVVKGGELSSKDIGPHDVHVLREYLSSAAASTLESHPWQSLQSIMSFLNMNDSLDMALLLQFRWILLKRCRQYLSTSREKDEEVEKVMTAIMNLLRKAVLRHITVSAVSARRELCLLMQWLLAFRGLHRDGNTCVVLVMDLLMQKLRDWIFEMHGHMNAEEAFLLCYLTSKNLLSSPQQYDSVERSSSGNNKNGCRGSTSDNGGDIVFMVNEGGLNAARTSCICRKQYILFNHKRRKQLFEDSKTPRTVK
jgi:hypothetical protein